MFGAKAWGWVVKKRERERESKLVGLEGRMAVGGASKRPAGSEGTKGGARL